MGFYMKGRKLYYKKRNAVMARRKGEVVLKNADGKYYCKKY